MGPGASSQPTPGPLSSESRLQDGGGRRWGALTLGRETGVRGNRRDQEPHFPTTTPTPHAPVPEAAVWMTSSRKHALFLRKWKVSEVWWGEWVSAATALRAPPCLTPHPRGVLILGRKCLPWLPLSPFTPPPQILRNQESWGEAVSPRGRRRDVVTQGMERFLGFARCCQA